MGGSGRALKGLEETDIESKHLFETVLRFTKERFMTRLIVT